jgi:hypothetical protein
MLNKDYCSDCEMLIGEVREYTQLPRCGCRTVSDPIIREEIAPFCMVANEFCDQLNICPLEGI